MFHPIPESCPGPSLFRESCIPDTKTTNNRRFKIRSMRLPFLPERKQGSEKRNGETVLRVKSPEGVEPHPFHDGFDDPRGPSSPCVPTGNGGRPSGALSE